MKKLPENSFLAVIEQSIIKNWNLPALSDFKGQTMTYKDVAQRITRLHMAFEICGIEKGDKVSIVGRNSANWGVIFLAVLSYKAVAVPILHDFKSDNVHHIVNHSESRILFAGDSNLEDLDEAEMPNLEAIISINDFSIIKSKSKEVAEIKSTLDAICKQKYPDGIQPDQIKYKREEPEQLALINYTSGTTGFSKGVMIPYRSLAANMLFAQETMNINPGESVVAMLPMAHMYGLAFEFMFEIISGAHVHFLTRVPTPKIILEAFDAVKPVLVISVPLVIEKIYRKQLLPAINKPAIKLALKLPIISNIVLKKINKKLTGFFGGNFFEIVVGGAPFSKDAEKFFKRLGFKYTVGYGMTECGPIITYEDWDKLPLYSCGKAVSRMEVKIDSTDPENIPGEIIVRGDNVMLGYYKRPDLTAETIKDGWLHTGDLGVLDKNGYLYIKGRSKTMLLGPSGQNIYPEEVESVLNNMPFVSESLVLEFEGKLAALIHPDYDAAEKHKLNSEELIKKLEEARIHANKNLPQYCQISQVRLLPEEFEKTPKKSIKRFLYKY